jgi:hypothetical protein
VNRKHTILALGATTFLALVAIDSARASCAADATLPEVKQRYADGQAKERAGRNADALRSYLGAQAYICDPNPVEADAAKRAAVISKPLAESAEKAGDLNSAYIYFEQGGHYASADRVIVAMLRTTPDDAGAFDRAREHFSHRPEGYFAVNNKVRIAAAGGYQLDRKLFDEVQGWPVKACERALQRETQAFSEDYVRDFVALTQARPEDATDFAALQALGQKQQAFQAKWKEDRIEASRKLLRTALDWSRRVADSAVQGKLVAQIRGVAAQRAQLLVQKYFSAPDMLRAAIGYYSTQDHKTEIAGVKTRARQLGADAEKRSALHLASDYYDVAGDREKSQALTAQANAQAQKKMQPDIEAAQRAAAEMQKTYSDPAKIAEMRRQAEEARKAMQKTQPQDSAKSAADLEKELGL